jgi:FkbH-like protein
VIEIEEVSTALPDVRTLVFPTNDDSLPALLADLSSLFRRSVVTAEDSDRTAMYRRRLETMVPVDVAGADVTAFLRGLQMSLAIHDRSHGDRARAVQLINKTNQFNINGRRVDDHEVGAILADGGRLYTCTLSDRTGSHGEILSCLIDGNGTIRSLVMSCRVFQRRVEYAFFAWLAGQGIAPKSLEFARTPRNEPATRFLEDSAVSTGDDGLKTIDWDQFTRANARDLELFALTAPGLVPAEDRS